MSCLDIINYLVEDNYKLRTRLNEVIYYGAYRALQELYGEGKIRSIGVSNFAPDRLADIVAFNKISPHVNQIETNPLHQQTEAQENMVNRGVQMEAWSPFGEGKSNMFNNP